MRDQSSRDGAAKHRVTVIQSGIDPAFLTAMKLSAKQFGEIIGCGLAFDVAAVARAYLLRVSAQTVSPVDSCQAQTGGLVRDFFTDDGRPRLFCQRARQIELKSQPSGRP